MALACGTIIYIYMYMYMLLIFFFSLSGCPRKDKVSAEGKKYNHSDSKIVGFLLSNLSLMHHANSSLFRNVLFTFISEKNFPKFSFGWN